MSAIPQGIARQLCTEIQEREKSRWYTFNGLWCWGCTTFTKNDPTKMCYANTPDNRGCAQVNQLYELRYEREIQDS